MRNENSAAQRTGPIEFFLNTVLHILPILCAVVIAIAALSTTPAFAEGSADMHATADMNYEDVNGHPPTGSPAIQYYTLETAPVNVMGSSTQQQRFKFYANAGETVFIGTSDIGHSGGGKLENSDVVITPPDGSLMYIDLTDETGGKIIGETDPPKGPNGVYMPKYEGEDGKNRIATGYEDAPVAGGYDAYRIDIETPGVYIVDFKSSKSNDPVDKGDDNSFNDVAQWDITVAKKDGESYKAISGRVWIDALVQGALNNYYTYFFCTTRDGYIYKYGTNSLIGGYFALASNSRGLIKNSDNSSFYHSVHEPFQNTANNLTNFVDKNGNDAGISMENPDNDTTDLDAPNHMFLNYPAADLPQDILLPNAKAVGSVTGLHFDGRTGETSNDGDDTKNTTAYVGAGGYFNIKTQDASSYRIVIDMSNMYAKDYHGRDNKECGETGEGHDDEICLGDGNFIFKDVKTGKWYEIDQKEGGSAHGDSEIKEIPEASYGEYGITGGEKPFSYIGQDFGEYRSCGQILLGNAATGSDRVYWNGRDQWGRSLPAGSYFGNNADSPGRVYAQAKAGEIHFPISDPDTKMAYGTSLILLNPPASLPGKDSKEALSKIYYNDQEKSILLSQKKVFNTDTSNKINGYTQWYFNLPHFSSESDTFKNVSDEGAYGKNDYPDVIWYPSEKPAGKSFDENFINKAIEGEASYNDVGGLTKNAAKFESNGADHGIVDLWTHIVSPVEFDIEGQVTLKNAPEHKIITGFVFMDEPGAANGQGFYSLKNNDVALAGATITAYKGSDTSGEEFYTTTSNSDGVYSVPIDTSNYNGNITIKVQMVDEYMKDNSVEPPQKLDGMSLYNVTTVPQDKNSAGSSKKSQTYSELPSISIQTVNLAEKNQRIIEVEDVGYMNEWVKKAIRIQKTWYPQEQYDPTLSSKFNVVGTIDNDGEPLEVYRRNGVVPSLSQGEVVDLQDLPGTTYRIKGDNESDGKIYGEDIIPASDDVTINYKVTEVIDQTEVEPKEEVADDPTTAWEGYMKDNSTVSTLLMKKENYQTADGKTVDLWLFSNRIYPSDLEVTVWDDANRDGKYDPEETPMPSARVRVEKFTVSTDTNDLTGSTQGSLGYKKEPGGTGQTEFLANDQSLPADADGKVKLYGLNAGKYRITVLPPEEEDSETDVNAKHTISSWNHNNDVYSKLKTEGQESQFDQTAKAKGYSKGREITIIIKIGNNTENFVRAGYAPPGSKNGGIEISKSVVLDQETSPEMQGFIISGNGNGTNGPVEAPKFNFELMLEQPPIVKDSDTENGPVSVDAPIFNAVENQYDGSTKLEFKKTEFEDKEVWDATFSLTAGSKIFIPNVQPNISYKIFEYVNGNDPDIDPLNRPNGSLTDPNATPMPKGFSIKNQIGSGRIQEGQVPGTGGDLTINYINSYNPEPITGYAETAPETATGETYDFKIKPQVKLIADGREPQSTDTFKLLLEPVGEAPEFKLEGGNTYDGLVVNSDNIGYNGNDATTPLSFGSNVSATFDKAGTYNYTLRQALPFKDGIDAIPGVSYDPTVYTLTVTVEHQYAQLAITSAKWSSTNGEFKDGNPLVFTNTYDSNVNVPILGTQIVESEIDGISADSFDRQFTYSITYDGVKNVGTDDDYVKPGEQVYPGELTQDNNTVGNNNSNIDFGNITFTPEMAGESKDEPKIYKYTIEQTKQPIGVGEPKLNPIEVYIAVYKETVNENGTIKEVVAYNFRDENGISLTGSGGFTFINTYSAELKTTLSELGVTLKTTVEGNRTPIIHNGDKFRFVLTGNDSESVKALGDKEVVFTYDATEDQTDAVDVDISQDILTFTNTGEYSFTLREVDPNTESDAGFEPIPGMTYDNDLDVITVVVTAPPTPDGTLKAELQQKITAIATEDKNQVTFVNTFDKDIQGIAVEGVKVVKSELADITASDFVDKFSFTLEPAGSKTVGDAEFGDVNGPEPDKNAVPNDRGSGSVFAFPLTFKAEQAGKTEDSAIIYRYLVTEDATNEPGITYDSNESQYIYVKVYLAVYEDAEYVMAVRCDANGNTDAVNGEPPYDEVAFTNYYKPEGLIANPYLKYDVESTGGHWEQPIELNEEDNTFSCDKLNHSHKPGDTIYLPEVDLSRWAKKDGCVLVGWSVVPRPELLTEPVKTLATEEEYLAPGFIAMSDEKIETVYAVWGIDENGNGQADYSEPRFTHMYHDNATLGGTVPVSSYEYTYGTLPADVEVMIPSGIDFAPGHETMQMDVTDENFDVRHYVQVGWSAEPHPAATSADEANSWQIPLDGTTRNISSVMDLSAYVIWAEDSDQDGTPDYSAPPAQPAE